MSYKDDLQVFIDHTRVWETSIFEGKGFYLLKPSFSSWWNWETVTSLFFLPYPCSGGSLLPPHTSFLFFWVFHFYSSCLFHCGSTCLMVPAVYRAKDDTFVYTSLGLYHWFQVVFQPSPPFISHLVSSSQIYFKKKKPQAFFCVHAMFFFKFLRMWADTEILYLH